MSQRSIRVDLAACQANCRTLKQYAGERGLFAVVKDDAYGHGMEKIASALAGEVDGLCVFAGYDALALRRSGYEGPILVMGGFADATELAALHNAQVWPVVHNHQQALVMASSPSVFERVALKVNTGMNRLGVPVDQADGELARIGGKVRQPLLMTHFACADEPGGTRRQAEIFNELSGRLNLPFTCSNTAATVLAEPPCPGEEFVRCGIGIYGASPVAGRPAGEFGLEPVMELVAPVCDARILEKGEKVGYGSTWQAAERTAMAAINIGYGDGYSRLARGAPVQIGDRRCKTVGRVSMDLTVVETGLPPVPIGVPAQMWGKQVSVDAV
ncbi:MAG: alanine racemase, partial [Betaproteobacteria bacterium]|nr:alanine racemase [Betaproteobacteria bacterium]